MILRSTLLAFFICLLVLLCGCADQSDEEEDNSNALFVILEDGKVGYMNRVGKTVITPQASVTPQSWVTPQFWLFPGRLCPVLADEKWGFIDTTGKIVIKPQFSRAYCFFKGFAPVRTGERWGYVDKKGNIIPKEMVQGIPLWNYQWVTELAQDSAAFDLLPICVDGKYGYVDKEGRTVVEPQFLMVGPFLHGRGAVFSLSVNRWGYVDIGGTLVIKQRFLEAFDFCEGVAAVKVDSGKWRIIDRDGKLLGKHEFDYIDRRPYEGLWRMRVNGKWGFCDSTASVVFEPSFDEADTFSEGVAAVCIAGKWGFVQKTERKMVIKCQFDEAWRFSSGMAKVRIGQRDVFIDKTGEVVLEPKYDWLADHFVEGLLPIGIGDNPISGKGRLAYINKEGKVVWEERLRTGTSEPQLPESFDDLEKVREIWGR